MSGRFLLFGLNQITGNFGCEALVQGTGAVLKRTDPDCEPIYISDGHAKTDRARLGPSSPIKVDDSAPRMGPRFFTRRLLRRMNFRVKRCPLPHRLLKDADCVLSIGGDLYTFVDEETEAVWPYPWPIVEDGNAIMDKGVPYVIWCASIGPLEKAGDKLGELVEHFHRCKAIIVRESASYDYMTNVLSIGENVYLASDPAYLMEPVAFEAPFLAQDGEPVVAINMALGSIVQVFGQDNKAIARVCEQYLEGMRRLIRDLGVKIVLIPHGVSDHAFMAGFRDKLAADYEGRVWLVPIALGAQKTKWAVSQCAGLVSMRFHCALAGIGTCTPTMLVLTKPKGKKLIEDVYGNTDYALDLRDFSPEALYEKAKLMLDSHASVRRTLEAVLDVMQKRALSAGEVLQQIL